MWSLLRRERAACATDLACITADAPLNDRALSAKAQRACMQDKDRKGGMALWEAAHVMMLAALCDLHAA